MLRRKLRFVRLKPSPLAVCERCGTEFESKTQVRTAGEAEIARAFKFHECQLLDSSQNALRIAREATEDTVGSVVKKPGVG